MRGHGMGQGRAGVQVWTAVPTAVGRVIHLLDEAERARLKKFRFEEDARSFACAHALTRLALSAVHGNDQAPADWKFRIRPFGKPEVAGDAALGFNLSHTRGLVAVATLPGGEVGVDVEAIGTRAVAEELRHRVLSPLEAAALDALPPGEQAARFFGIWSLKESYIKARGLGLRLPLKGISFSFDPVHGAALAETPGAGVDGTTDSPGDWSIHHGTVSAGADHALGVTAFGRATEIHAAHVDLLELI